MAERVKRVEVAEIFNAVKVPFTRGINLVEASAGTGKTYAIGMLVLRGVVELGISIDKILIVTFTKAATEELKDRIRSRLAEARDGLQKLEESGGNDLKIDETLKEWLLRVEDRGEALRRLQLALYDIDSASIFTIHSFCQRMLVDQALESGQLFNLELVSSIDHVITELVEDFWREEIYTLDPFTCSLITSTISTPDQLLATVTEAFRQQSRIEPASQEIEIVQKSCEESFAKLQDWWEREGEALQRKFTSGVEGKYFKKWLLENCDSWVEEVSAFIAGDTYVLPQKMELLTYDGLMEELNGSKLQGNKKQLYLEEFSLPSKEVESLLTSVQDLLLALRQKLAERREEIRDRLLAQGTLGFNGLIENLAAALDGERGELLSKVIGARYTLALIDEFQDTDSLQYKIFSRLFGRGQHLLYLIGDPKQAIYKFRGADIHSYFVARKAAQKRLTLEKNYRSHQYLVEEVNRLFASRQNPFLYEESMLDYSRVKPGIDETKFDIVVGDESLAGMIYCSLPQNDNDKSGRWTSGAAADAFCQFSVVEISKLLAKTNSATYRAEGKERNLVPGDIAVLVRSHKHAAMYQEALLAAGIPAVISSKSSVFRAKECLDLITLLRAIAVPNDLNRLKSAMAVDWFNFSGNELYDEWQDEERLSHWRERITTYNRLWLDSGVFLMMNSCIREEEILTTIAEKPGAERRIVNIFHLVELLQEQETTENYGPGQLLQWLQNMYLKEETADGTELLLESDEDAVQIVTMHGAKGLEYPVVFCPYLWYSTGMLDRERFQVSVHEAGKNIVDLGSEHFEDRKLTADYDQRAEELRLLYVALTRAKVRCYCMWADVKKHTMVRDSFESPLGYLLFSEGQCGLQEQEEKFNAIAEVVGVSHQLVDADAEIVRYSSSDSEEMLSPLIPSSRSLATNWQMTSFSGLAALSDYEYEFKAMSPAADFDTPIPVIGLPAGASFGNVIHDLLEDNVFSELTGNPEIVPDIEKKLQRYGVSAESDDILKLLQCVVSTELPVDFSLASTSPEYCLKEMPFYFHLEEFHTGRIHQILKEDPAVLPVTDKQVRGYLTGFVDLICFINNKYYVIDYKTNYLGETLADYCGNNLIEAMKSHNYGLQYWIYSLVLHRHLENLIQDYSYDEHFGGVMYLFVRGMSPEQKGSGVYFTRPNLNTLQQFSALFNSGEKR